MSGQNIVMSVGYESTPIDDAQERFGTPLDVLDTTRHYERIEHDFDLQEALGVRHMRYHAMWDKVLMRVCEKHATGEYDWRLLEPIYDSMRRRGFVPTADLCHHKVPRKIARSFANPAFPQLFQDFALQFQQNFPWVKRYALINEAAVTALFHANGLWGNYAWSEVFLNMAEAVHRTATALKERDPEVQFFYPEPIDHDVAEDSNDAQIVEWVDFLTTWGRFGMDDLLQGKIGDCHGFFKHLVKHGANPDRVLCFRNNPSMPYERSLDFYPHCFKMWFRDRSTGMIVSKNNPHPPSLAEVISEYQQHMPGVKLGIGEINIRGTIHDRITFWKWTLCECLKADIPFYTWWGLTDADTWGGGNFTRHVTTDFPDPVGIYTLSDHPAHGRLWNRHANEFSELFAAFVRGEISAEDIPAYKPTGELAPTLNCFIARHMRGWHLRDPALSERSA